MTISRRALRLILASALLAILAGGLWLLRSWQPQRQLEIRTRHLLESVADRDWSAVEAMLAADYLDSWNHDRQTALEDARMVFSQFLVVRFEILAPVEVAMLSEDRGSASLALALQGRGSALAQAAINTLAEHPSPWVFTWRRSGPMPWQWQLMSLAHPGLEGPSPP